MRIGTFAECLPKEYSKENRINKYALSLHANMTPRAGLDKDKTEAHLTVKSSKDSHQFIEKRQIDREKADWIKGRKKRRDPYEKWWVYRR